ncbi:hypothetical protein BU15DRAFT_68203 [Melanogaster broomeanus]|nr:hypothetical protein BU15DRAFT_68203 [Melanogaster broomeanus]
MSRLLLELDIQYRGGWFDSMITGALEGGRGVLRRALQSYASVRAREVVFGIRGSTPRSRYTVLRNIGIHIPDLTYTENANNLVVEIAWFSMGQGKVGDMMKRLRIRREYPTGEWVTPNVASETDKEPAELLSIQYSTGMMVTPNVASETDKEPAELLSIQ